MQYLAPLLQTVLWVLLVGGVVWRFHRPIHGLLEALQRRVEAGSAVEAGPFKLGAEVKPTPPEKQKERAESETSQVFDQIAKLSSSDASAPKIDLTRSRVANRLFLAEELAIRAAQAEFGTTINRQISIAPGIEADGAFIYNNRLHLIEVKFIVSTAEAATTVRRALSHYDDMFGQQRRNNIVVVLALVFQFENDVVRGTIELQSVAREFSLKCEVRGWALSQLQQAYGLPTEPDA